VFSPWEITEIADRIRDMVAEHGAQKVFSDPDLYNALFHADSRGTSVAHRLAVAPSGSKGAYDATIKQINAYFARSKRILALTTEKGRSVADSMNGAGRQAAGESLKALRR